VSCCDLLRGAVGVGDKDVLPEGHPRGLYIEIRNTNSAHVVRRNVACYAPPYPMKVPLDAEMT